MRRFAKVFVSKHADRDKDNTQRPPAPTAPQKRPLPTLLRNINTRNTHSSSSSSSASTTVSVHTPDDDSLNPPPSIRRLWKSWIGAKSKNLLPKSHDEDDDDDDDNPLDDIHYDVAPVAKKNLEIYTRNSLASPLPISPFVHHQPGPMFPRSVNRVSHLPQKSTLRVQILKSHLLTRLSNITPQHLSAIIPFSAKPTPSLIPPPSLSDPDISRPSGATKILSASPGLRRWISRPCFEDRYTVYFPSQHGVDCRPVSPASLAIAALEYSEHLDVMVDPDFDQSPKSIVFDAWSLPAAEDTLPPTQSHSPTLDPPPVTVIPPVQSRNSYTATPSPLRNEHGPEPVFSVKVDSPDVDKSPNKTSRSAVKRVVRFAEDDDDDGIPLHIVRMKKKREEKAKFLQQERSRREQQQVEEKLRLERETLEKECRRLVKEQERREREMALYAETLAATRMRRETQRAGGVPSATNNNSASNNLLVPSPSFTSLRDSERNKHPPEPKRYSSQLSYDPPAAIPIPRREFSDSALHSNSYFNYQSDSPSPGSSRPPSLAHSPVSPTGMGINSRPPSTYSSSSEDVRHQGRSRRNSMMAAAAPLLFNGGPPMVVSYPTWSGSNPNFQYVPPVPMFPDFVHDMPLLPPTAPFMKDRRSLRGSTSPGPPSTSSSRGGSTSSTERASVPINLPRASSAPRSLAQPPNSPMLSSGPRKADGQHRHERRSSGDSRNSSWTQSSQRPRPSHPPNSYSQPVSSRGRPPIPTSSQYLQAPSPWTALPTQNGMIPVAMPLSSFSHTNLRGMSPSRTGKAGGGEMPIS